MVHDHLADVAASVGAGWPEIAARLGLLLLAAVVAGIGLVAPWLHRHAQAAMPRRLVRTVWAAGAGSAVLAVASVLIYDVSVVGGGVHAALSLAVPALLRWPVAARWTAAPLLLVLVVESAAGRSGLEFALDTGYVVAATAWFGIAALVLGDPAARRRPVPARIGPLATSLAALLTGVGALRLALSGIGIDRRLFSSAYGLLLVAAVVLPAAATVANVLRARAKRSPGAIVTTCAGLVAGALLAWTALVAVPTPPDLPVPGKPLLGTVHLEGRDVPVLVTPHRPGPNLVHLPESAGTNVTIRAGGEQVVATKRPGAQGLWAEVQLPPGRSDVIFARGASSDELGVDTGELAPRPLPADDGPECAAAALGSLVAERPLPVDRCPSDVLTSADETALRELVRYLDSHGVRAITLVADATPRGRAAGTVVRSEAARAGIRVLSGPARQSALVIVSGWRTAHQTAVRAAKEQLEAPTYIRGIYLAPWLLNEPIATSVASASVPLRFDPREPAAIDFTVRIGDAFGGQRPSVGAYREYLRANGLPEQGPLRVFAVAQVSVMSMPPGAEHAPGMAPPGEGPGHWIARATVVPVSLPLADADG